MIVSEMNLTLVLLMLRWHPIRRLPECGTLYSCVGRFNAGIRPAWVGLVLRIGLGLTLLAVFATGCATRKRTWGDWQAAADPSGSGWSVLGVPELPMDAPPPLYRPPYQRGDAAVVGKEMDLAMRNPDFPATYLAAVHVDLTGPSNSVQLVWSGPMANLGPVGPWRSCPGRGTPDKDCNDVGDSNTLDSWCTPKGVFPVAGFDDRLNAVPSCCYVTWVIHDPRYIAIHSHTEIPYQSVSHGCIRVPHEVAKLIHNNSIAGVTLIHIYGTWTRPAGLRG